MTQHSHNSSSSTPQENEDTVSPSSAPEGQSVPSDHDLIFNQEGQAQATEEEGKASIEQKLSEMTDKWMRAEAENQNIRARSKREIEDARQYAVQKFARDVVETAENLKRGLASLPAKTEEEDAIITKMREGFESTERSFLSILERHGIVCNDPTGAVFDANLHQAMAEQPSADHPAGTILQAWTPTWTLHGRLLKPAMVVVAKNIDNSSSSIDQENEEK